jgi:hypothetical protein
MVLEFGATRCVREPFVPATLLKVIDMCLAEAAAARKGATAAL